MKFIIYRLHKATLAENDTLQAPIVRRMGLQINRP